jgi:hypothetical protein
MADDGRMVEQAARRYCRRCDRSVLATRRVPAGAVVDPFVVLGTLGLALLFRKTGLDERLEPFRCPSCGSAVSDAAGTVSSRPHAEAPGQSPSAAPRLRAAREFVEALGRLSDAPGSQSAPYRKSIRHGVLYYYGPKVTAYVDTLVGANNAGRAVKLLKAGRPYRRPRAQRFVRTLFPVLLLDLVGTCVVVGGLVGMVRSSRSTEWPTAEGTVIASGIDTVRGDDGTTYRIAARYTYQVNEVAHVGSRVSYNPGGSDWATAARAVAKYAPGMPVVVHYDRNKPSRSVLEPGMAMAGIIAVVVGLSLLVSSAVTIALLLRRPLAEVRELERHIRST